VYRYRILLILTLALLASAAHVQACENPTYAYIYDRPRFAPDPYLLICYNSPDAPADAEVAEAVKALADEEGYRTVNLEYVPVDVTKMDEFPKDGPEALAWEEYKDVELPFYVVMAPVGMGRYFELQAGKMSAKDIGPLIKSPKRQELAKLLALGKQGVLIVLEGSDKKANAAAMKVIAEATADDVDDVNKEIDSGLVIIRRDDPNEEWFIRQLLKMDESLPDEKGPLVYPAFARGFICGPFGGRGITVENIWDEVVYFLNGNCTCRIKDQLYEMGYFALIDFDWDVSYIAEIRSGGEPPEIDDDPMAWVSVDDTSVQPARLVGETGDGPASGIGDVVGSGLTRFGVVIGIFLILGTATVFLRRKAL